MDKNYTGLVIKVLRNHVYSLNQTELADKMDISQSALSKVEKGILELGLGSYYRMLDSFKISSSQFEKMVTVSKKFISNLEDYSHDEDIHSLDKQNVLALASKLKGQLK